MKSKKIILIGAVVIIVLLSIFLVLMPRGENKKVKVKHTVVDKLYKNLELGECTNFTDSNKNDAMLYLVFNQMKRDKVISDEISVNDYKAAVEKVFGKNNVDLSVNNYAYGNYVYSLANDKITRKEAQCNSKYVSKLYGYTYDDDTLKVDIKVGYISDDKVYDLAGKELGNYDKDSVNKLLDKGTLKSYSYIREGNDYYLKA